MIFYPKPTKFLLFLSIFCLGNLQAQTVQPVADPSQFARESEKQEGYELQFPALGTLVNLTAYSDSQLVVEQAFEEAKQLVAKLEATLTDYDPNSETRLLSQRAIEEPVRVSQDLWDLLAASQAWNERTDGAFDSSLGALTVLWRKYRRTPRIPSDEEIQTALTHTGWGHLRLDLSSQSVQIDDPHLRLDFGAIGKGYIVDRVFELLQKHGLDCCLINISGNMRCGTAPPGRTGWRISISPIERGGEPIRKIQLRNAAIATSGDLWQYVVIDGKRRSHILDPKSGVGVPGPLAVTVITDNATDADAFATAACVLGWESAANLAQKMGGIEFLHATMAVPPLRISATEGFPLAE